MWVSHGELSTTSAGHHTRSQTFTPGLQGCQQDQQASLRCKTAPEHLSEAPAASAQAVPAAALAAPPPAVAVVAPTALAQADGHLELGKSTEKRGQLASNSRFLLQRTWTGSSQWGVS